MLLVVSLRVALTKSKEHLHEDLPDDVFSDKVFFSATLLDQLRHVAVLTVLHHDEELFLFFKYDSLKDSKV